MAETTTFLAMNGKPVQINGWFFNRDYWKKPLTLTLETDGHGTLTANTITGYAGDTVELTTAYNTYYRFSGYNVTGGTIDGNTFTFSEEDATAYAAFKPNAFTATGGFEKGSNVSCTKKGKGSTSTNVAAKYATHAAHTGNVPAEWYSTSNRWKPNGASAYTIRLIPKMTFTASWDTSNCKAATTAVSLIGSTQTQSQGFSYNNSNRTFNYSKNFTSTTQNVNYGISAKLQVTGYHDGTYSRGVTATYIANSTTGTWSATGYAP